MIDKNSWILPIPLSHKLHDKIVAICQCGTIFQVDYYSYLQLDNPSCCCPSCDNTFFINTILFKTKKQFLETLRHDIEQKRIEDAYLFNAFLSIPFWDQSKQEIAYEQKTLMSLSYAYDTVIEKSCNELCHLYSCDDNDGKMKPLKTFLEHTLYNELSDFLWEDIAFNQHAQLRKQLLCLSEESGKKRYEIYQFFIASPRYNTLELYYWNKTFLYCYAGHDSIENIFDGLLKNQHKAIKRIYFEQYKSLNLLTTKIIYDPSPDYCFMKSFQDPNYIQRLMKIPYRRKQCYINVKNLEKVFLMIGLLKRYYTEKKIVNLFVTLLNGSDVNPNTFLHFEDTLRFFSTQYVTQTLEIHLHSSKLTLFALHNELLIFHNISKKQVPSTLFTYLEIFQNACVIYDELEFRLPSSNSILYKWGRTLHNCLRVYDSYVAMSKGIIYGVFIDDKLMYAINISHDLKLIEARAKYNQPISPKHMKIINQWFDTILKRTIS